MVVLESVRMLVCVCVCVRCGWCVCREVRVGVVCGVGAGCVV